MSKIEFVFDAPTGTFRSDEVSERLRQRALKFGPEFARYAPIKFGSLADIGDVTSAVARLLVYQCRYLLRAIAAQPELRIAQAADFGRAKMVCWYAPEYEGEVCARLLPFPDAIDPQEVL